MTKSTITITDDDKCIKLEVAHDPVPTGPRETWHIPALIADSMAREMIEKGKEEGMKTFFEATKNAMTGHINVTTRKESNGPDQHDGTDSKADEHDGRRGGRIP